VVFHPRVGEIHPHDMSWPPAGAGLINHRPITRVVVTIRFGGETTRGAILPLW